jgi:GNAT superfamily N-acetyltransferase
MIRRAFLDDVPAIRDLMASKVRGFLNTDVSFSPLSYEAKVAQFITSGSDDAACLVSEVRGNIAAAILLYVIEHPTIGERVGLEASWLADPRFAGHGMRLLKAAESWFKSRGARRYFVACNDDRTARMLELTGHRQTERVFEHMV